MPLNVWRKQLGMYTSGKSIRNSNILRTRFAPYYYYYISVICCGILKRGSSKFDYWLPCLKMKQLWHFMVLGGGCGARFSAQRGSLTGSFMAKCNKVNQYQNFKICYGFNNVLLGYSICSKPIVCNSNNLHLALTKWASA